MRARDNPFNVQCLNGLAYRATDFSLRSLLDRWNRLGRRGLLVGPKGRGKTTLLEQLQSTLGTKTELLSILLREGDSNLTEAMRRRLEEISPQTVILVDGLEQLNPWSWWRLRRRIPTGGGILATSHLAGRLPVLRVCETSAVLLKQLVDELAPRLGLDSIKLEVLFRRHQGNLRTALLELYDRFSMVGGDLVKSDFRRDLVGESLTMN